MRIEPSSAFTVIGRKNPALFGASEDITDRSAKYTADFTNESVQLIAPATCGELPAKSNITSSSRTSTATRIGTGQSGCTPSSSRKLV